MRNRSETATIIIIKLHKYYKRRIHNNNTKRQFVIKGKNHPHILYATSHKYYFQRK